MKIGAVFSVCLLSIAGFAAVSSVAQINSQSVPQLQQADEKLKDAQVDQARLRPPVPNIDLKAPDLNSTGSNAHVGRLWITPVLMQKSGSTASLGARVRVRSPGENPAGIQKLPSPQPIGNAQGDKADAQSNVGGSSQAMTSQSSLQQQQLQQQISAATKQRELENEEKRMCRRRARNAWERFTGFFGAKHTEECPSSVRRRGTIVTEDDNVVGVKNTLYFINLSTANTTNVQIACRVRDQSSLIVANVSVAPLDFGEWEPPCACERDYKFWCTLASPEPIAAHAVAAQKSGGREVLEYIDFFLSG